MAHKYCSVTTVGHPCSVRHAGCIQKMVDILGAEGGGKKYPPAFTDVDALNVDDVEKIVNLANQNPSCDFMIGVSKEGKDCKAVLIECKFDVKPQNFDRKLKTEIAKKVSASKRLLSYDSPFWDCAYVLVHKNAMQEARSRLSRLFSNGKQPPFEFLDMATLEAKFF